MKKGIRTFFKEKSSFWNIFKFCCYAALVRAQAEAGWEEKRDLGDKSVEKKSNLEVKTTQETKNHVIPKTGAKESVSNEVFVFFLFPES